MYRLLNLAKVISKNDLRNYSQVIAVREGKAYVTDGFAALRFNPQEKTLTDGVYEKDLSPSTLKYPSVEAVLPTAPGENLNSEAFDKYRRLLKGGINAYFSIDVESGETALYPEIPTKGINFNALYFVKYCKAIPVKATCTQASFHKEMGVLQLTYTDKLGIYTLVIVSLKENNP